MVVQSVRTDEPVSGPRRFMSHAHMLLYLLSFRAIFRRLAIVSIFIQYVVVEETLLSSYNIFYCDRQVFDRNVWDITRNVFLNFPSSNSPPSCISETATTTPVTLSNIAHLRLNAVADKPVNKLAH